MYFFLINVETIDTIINIDRKIKKNCFLRILYTMYYSNILYWFRGKKKKKEKWTKNSRNYYFEIKDYEWLISMFRPNYSVVTFTSIIWIIELNIWTGFIILNLKKKKKF